MLRHSIALLALTALAACGGQGPGSPPAPQTGSPNLTRLSAAAGGELLYVANGTAAVDAYAAGGSGYVLPVYHIGNPHIPDSYWNLWELAFDRGGNLYAQSFLSDATSFVFAPDVTGHVKPIRAFMGDGPDTRGITVDSNGYEYIASGQASAVISVLPRKANGKPSQLYHVNPLRQFSTDETLWFPWPQMLTIDSRNDIVAGVVRAQESAIEIYTGGPDGSGKPVRVITGAHTNLGQCSSSSCEHITVGFSVLRRIFAGVTSYSGNTRILAFSEDSSGNVPPAQDIEGSNTGLTGKVITGVAVSQRNGEIYAMVKGSQFGSIGTVNVYAAGANGNSAPLRVMYEPSNGFTNAQGIGLTPQPSRAFTVSSCFSCTVCHEK